MESNPFDQFDSVQAEGGNPFDQFDAPEAAPVVEPPSESIGSKLKREFSPANLASAAVRPLVKGLAAVPGVFADGTMTAWNLATGQNNQMPSEALNATLDKYTRKPEGVGKAAEIVSSAVVSSRLPMPQFGKQAPPSFQPTRAPQSPAQATFEEGRRAGYVAPPSTVKPSVGKSMVESLAGKAATQQASSSHNQKITNELIRKELGMAKDSPITREALGEIRAKAGKVYSQVSMSGGIKADKQYTQELDDLIKTADDIAADFPDANVAAGNEIAQLVKSLKRDGFKASSAMAYLKELRKQASGNLSGINAADPAKKALGQAQRDAAGALEDMVMRHLTAQGKGDLAKSFDDARTLIAKTYSVEGALNQSTGNVVARQLASQLKKGKPLSGGIRTAAKFSEAFPKATEELRNSGPVSALDAVVTAGGISAINPGFIAWPLARMGARYGLLSGPAQNALADKAPRAGNALGRWMGAGAAVEQY